mgnify:CR=1 FL=1
MIGERERPLHWLLTGRAIAEGDCNAACEPLGDQCSILVGNVPPGSWVLSELCQLLCTSVICPEFKDIYVEAQNLGIDITAPSTLCQNIPAPRQFVTNDAGFCRDHANNKVVAGISGDACSVQQQAVCNSPGGRFSDCIPITEAQKVYINEPMWEKNTYLFLHIPPEIQTSFKEKYGIDGFEDKIAEYQEKIKEFRSKFEELFGRIKNVFDQITDVLGDEFDIEEVMKDDIDVEDVMNL